MTRALVLAVLLVVAAVGPGVAAAAVTGEPEIAVALADDTVVPGEETTLEVTLANGGGVDRASLSSPTLNERVTTARDVEVSVGRVRGPIDVTTDARVVGSLPGGTTTTLGFDVVVDENASAGTYRIPVSVEYTYTDFISEETGIATDDHRRRSFSLRVRVDRRGRITVVETASDVAVGQRGTVKLTVENVGPEAVRRAQLTLSSPNEDLTVGGAASASRYLGTVAPGERRNVSYVVAAAATAREHPYALELAPVFEDGEGRTVEDDPRRLGVTPRPDLSFAVENVTTDLRVGRRGTVQGTVTNRGDRAAENAVVVLESGSPSVALSETRYPLGTLGAGQSSSFSLRAAVPDAANEGPRSFVASVEYETPDGDVLTSDRLRFAATVGPERDRLRLESVNASFAPDTDNRLVVRVTNVGDEPLTDVQATLRPAPPFESEAPESYLPSLAPGESARLAFALTVSEDAVDNTHGVAINVTAEDVAGDPVRTGPHLVTVQVARPVRAASDVSLFAGAALLVIAILAAGWWWLRH